MSGPVLGRASGWVPIIRSWALTRGFALHPGTRNRYEIRDTRTQHRPASRQVNNHGRVPAPTGSDAESIIGLYKTELLRNRGPWRGLDDLELATPERVDWFNHRRLNHHNVRRVPPAEDLHYRRQHSGRQATAQTTASMKPGEAHPSEAGRS